MSESFAMLDLPNASRSPQHTFGWRDGESVSCDAFLTRVRAWRALLQRTAGSSFALFYGDSIEFASALFGAWHAGKTIYLPSDTLPATCAALRAEVDGYLGEFAAEWTPLTPSDEDTTSPDAGFLPLSSDFAGLFVYTSGSTGEPQAIPKRLSQLAAEVDTLEALFGNTLADADIIATVSHQHIYGLLFKVLWPLTAGRALHARSYAFPEELAAASAARDCVLISSPAHLKRLPESAAWTTASHRLRAVFSSGGPLPRDTAQVTRQLLGLAPIEVYGSSETGGIAWRQRNVQNDDAWSPLPGVAWRIESHDSVLEVQSPHLPKENTVRWFRMADRVQPAAGERFLLQGRVDRIAKIEEKRISLDAIESALMASPLVAQARVLVLENGRQRVAAFVAPSEQGRTALDELGKLAFNRMLRATLAQSVELVALPRLWRYLDALPLNAQGKTTYTDLLALLDEEEGDADKKSPRKRLLEQNATRAVFELVAPSDLYYFNGHFPGAPILAGVVQVDWAFALGRERFDLPPVFLGIHALKFQRVIRPEMPVVLELVHEVAKSSLLFRYTSEAGQHASGRILLGAADV